MPPPAKWSWDIGNVNASAAQTQAAYQAITHNGRTRDFSVIVWNDIIDKIIEQRQSWGDVAWSQIGVPLMTAYMAPGEQMTAAIFYSAVQNMPPIHPWGWEATLERKEIRRGDTCYGAYFIYLTDGLNHWMDLTPMPFSINLVPQTTLVNDVLVRRALHIINSQNLIWNYSVTVDVNSPQYIIVPIDIVTDIRMDLPLFGTPHVEQHLYFHAWMHNDTSILEITPVEIDYLAQLDMNVEATRLSLLSMIGEVNGQLNFIGALNIPSSLPVAIDNLIELISSAEISTFASDEIVVSITGRCRGEAWAFELDSEPIAIHFEPDLLMSVAFSTQTLEPMTAPLNVIWTPTANISPSGVIDASAELDPELNLNVTIGENSLTSVEGEISGRHNMSVRFSLNSYEACSANAQFALNASATVEPATDEVDVRVNLPVQTNIAARIESAIDKQYTGANLRIQPTINVNADVSTHVQAARISMTDSLSMSARVEVVQRYQEINGTVTGIFTSEATVEDLRDHPTLSVAANTVITLETRAEFDTYDNRLYLVGTIGASHTGSVEFDMLNDVNISGTIDPASTISINVDTWSTLHIITNMSFNSTASMTIDTKRLVLASEIDNTLASDLDNTLVENVEFR